MTGYNETKTQESKEDLIAKLELAFTVPEDAELIDDTFYVWKTRFGLFQTMTTEGRKMSTGGTRDAVVVMTRWILKCEQEGYPEGSVRVIGTAYVGGKL